MYASSEEATDITSDLSFSSGGSEKIPSLDLQNNLDAEEKSFSPVDIEIQIQNERIIYIFKEAIEKTEIAVFILLTSLKEFNKAIRKFVTAEDFLCIRKILESGSLNIVDPRTDDKFYKIITFEQIEKLLEEPDQKMLPELSQIFKILLKYPQFHDIIKKEFDWEKSHLPDVILFYDSLIELRDKMEEKIQMSAMDKLKNAITQRNLLRINKVLKERITDVTQKLKEETRNFRHTFKQKDSIIKHHQDELSLLKNECITIIKKKILDSERVMNKETENHNTNYESLVEEEKNVKEKYDDLLRDHLNNEKNLRAKRFKVETQLTNWLQKYDKEIGDKQTELDGLTKEYEDEKKELADLQGRFNDQEEKYIPLMAEKEAEYQADLAIRLERFQTNYASTKIQRWWRAILEKEGKKKKKGKKKK